MPTSRRTFLKYALYGSLLAARPAVPALARPAAAQRVWAATGREVPELAQFDVTMSRFMVARSISAGALAITRNGKLVLARGYTWRDDSADLLVQPSSLFRMASITKPLTAVAVLQLVQAGKLNLDARVASLLGLRPPPGGTADARLRDITVRHLLQHLGGWDRDLAFDPMFRDYTIAAALGRMLPINKYDIARYMAGQLLQHAPGTTYSYSNYGYSLLGQVIERISGQPYYSYLNQHVLAPLGIVRIRPGATLARNRLSNEVAYHSQYQGWTVFDESRQTVPSPYGAWNLENMDSHGALLASPVDLVRFASAFDRPASSPLLSQASIDLLFGLPENIPAASYHPGDWYYGCGWLVRDWRNGYRNTWHDGSLPGTTTLLVRRGDGLSWCVMFNQRDDPSGYDYGNSIDGALHNTADYNVSTWPSHDLFGEYLRAERVLLPMSTS